MDILLGAWGLGNLARNKSTVRGHDLVNNSTSYNIPPISSNHIGCVEIFPFLLFDKVYIDERAYNCLLKDGVDRFELSKRGKEILLEFARQKILIPIDYSQIILSDLDQISESSEKDLLARNLPFMLKRSRIMWSNFLRSAGGQFHPNRDVELLLTEKEINLIDSGFPKTEIQHRAIHDIYDINTMLAISKKLDVAICDWQMYSPFYEHKMQTSTPWLKSLSLQNLETIHNDIDIYIPVPNTTDLDCIFQIREDPAIKSFKNYAKFLKESTNNYTPEEFIMLRKQLLSISSKKISHLNVFPFSGHLSPIFSEDLVRKIVKDEFKKIKGTDTRTPDTLIQIFQSIKEQELIMGDNNKFENIKTNCGSSIQIGVRSTQAQNHITENMKYDIDSPQIVSLLENIISLIETNLKDEIDKKDAREAAEKAINEISQGGYKNNLQRVKRYLETINCIAGYVSSIGNSIKYLQSLF